MTYAEFVHQCADAVTARRMRRQPAVLLIDVEGIATRSTWSEGTPPPTS